MRRERIVGFSICFSDAEEFATFAQNVKNADSMSQLTPRDYDSWGSNISRRFLGAGIFFGDTTTDE